MSEKTQIKLFEDKKVLESGRQFYDDLQNIFSDEDFFRLRYLSMDALVYPIAASDDEKSPEPSLMKGPLLGQWVRM